MILALEMFMLVLRIALGFKGLHENLCWFVWTVTTSRGSPPPRMTLLQESLPPRKRLMRKQESNNLITLPLW